MIEPTPVLIALGSNIGRERNLPQAIAMLEDEPEIRLRAVSSVYETMPVGGRPNQPSFFNAAALIETDLEPPALKGTLLSIERRLGRVRTGDKYAPRPIDLDIALYGQQVLDLQGRRIPDPDVARFPHVALPLADVAPDWVHPELNLTLREIASDLQFSQKEIQKIMNTSVPILRINGNGNGNGNGHHASKMDVVSKEVYDPHFEALVEQMLTRVGEDPQRDGLKRTPLRVAKAMDFLTSGYETSLEEVINGALFEDDTDEMVIVKDIEFYSLCEHHMLPFFGKAHIGYIPNGKIIGLSKVARLVDLFARRLQVQERLTGQIADTLMKVLDARGVGVVLEGSHFCMMMRGVQKQNSSTVTHALRGSFKTNSQTRQEFMQSVRG